MNIPTLSAAMPVLYHAKADLEALRLPVYGFGAFQQIHCENRPNPIAMRDHFMISRLGPYEVLISLLAMPSRSSAEYAIVSELESIITGVSQNPETLRIGDLICMLNRRFFDMKQTYFAELKRSRTEGFFCARLNIRDHTIRYSNAGYHALIARSQGEIESLYDGGPPLGMSREVRYLESETSLKESTENLVVFDQAFGRAATAAEIVTFMRSHSNDSCYRFWNRMINRWCNGAWTPNVEDATLLVIKRADHKEAATLDVARSERDWHAYESRKIGDDILVRGSYRIMSIEE